MDTNRLRQFVVAYETQNLRKTAEMLNISHSAISKSLKILQEEISLRLFQQEGRRIVPTDHAHLFYPKVKEFLKTAESLFSIKSVEPFHIAKIGTFEVFSTYLLGSKLNKYLDDYQHQIFELLPGSLEKALLESKIDVGISYEPIPMPGLEFTKIGRIKMKIYSRKGAFKKLSFDEIPFVAPISPIEGTPTGTKGLDGWPENKFARNIQYRVDMMESGLSLVRMGHAAIFLPEFLSRLHNEVVKSEFSLEEIQYPHAVLPVYRNIYLLKRKSTVEGYLYKKIGNLLRNECIEN